jgi:hypothetical protein
MTTIGASIKVQPKVTKMGKKRIFINTGHLAPAIEAVRREIIDVIQPKVIDAAISVGRVPLRLKSGFAFHQSEISHIIDSALLMLHRDMKNVTQATWAKYTERYKNIPTDKDPARGGYGEGVMNVIFYDDDEIGAPTMVELADAIAEYIDALADVHIPYLFTGGSTSYKIIGSLALIHAEEVLKKAANNDAITTEEKP